MKIFQIGDVFGKPGRRAIFSSLPRLIENEPLDLVIANAENIAGGKGLTAKTCEELFSVGVDVITTGNHVRDKKEIDEMLVHDSRLLRPLNYPLTMPGRGATTCVARNGAIVAVVNSMGRVHMGDLASPFEPTKNCVTEMKSVTPIVMVDFHAEATSEKRAMGWYLDGSATAVLGTHTHVQTADEMILPKGTAYMTDIGMTGPHESVIGLRIDLALERFLQGKRSKFEVAKGDVRLCGAIVTVDETTGRAISIKRLRIDL